MHPYPPIHFVLLDGRCPFKGCPTQVIVVTDQPDKTTCPNCRHQLQGLERLLALLARAEDDAVSA